VVRGCEGKGFYFYPQLSKTEAGVLFLIMKITFVIGGARSGKSSVALKEASMLKGQKAYIATAQALDKEMKERIEKHKKERGADWDTYEEPLKVVDLISKLKNKHEVVLLDCLTIWLSNTILGNSDIKMEMERMIAALKNLQLATCNLQRIFIISNEVGMGIVPENELARRFRDMAGQLNQKIAETADEVYLVTAGIPMKIKS